MFENKSDSSHIRTMMITNGMMKYVIAANTPSRYMKLNHNACYCCNGICPDLRHSRVQGWELACQDPSFWHTKLRVEPPPMNLKPSTQVYTTTLPATKSILSPVGELTSQRVFGICMGCEQWTEITRNTWFKDYVCTSQVLMYLPHFKSFTHIIHVVDKSIYAGRYLNSFTLACPQQ